MVLLFDDMTGGGRWSIAAMCQGSTASWQGWSGTRSRCAWGFPDGRAAPAARAYGRAADGQLMRREGRRSRGCRAVPYGLLAAMAGAVSDLICEADNDLRPLREVLDQTW